MTPLSASELLRWGDLEARRRRQSRGLGGLLTWSPVVTVALSALLALEVWRRIHEVDGNIGPLGFALMAIAFSEILAVFGTPYRMYWRSDSSLLARLAIDGGALFKLASWRSWRAAGLALLPGASSVGVFAVAAAVPIEVAARLGVVALTCALIAGLAAPAACLAGGAIVASDKAQAMIDSFGGEVQPPGVTWLGALPGLVAMSIALVVIMTSDWVALAEPLASRSLVICAVAATASVVAFVVASRAAPGVLIEAQREVAALDQERLAHIDRSKAGPIERLWGALTARRAGEQLIYAKDAALMRRRYPAPYFVAFIGVVTAWILAATSQPVAALVVICSLAAYAIVMARRHASRPVEQRRLVRTLPLSGSQVASAKRSAAVLRALTWVAVPSASMLVFSDDLASAIVVPAAALALALVGGALMAAERIAR